MLGQCYVMFSDNVLILIPPVDLRSRWQGCYQDRSLLHFKGIIYLLL